MRCVPGCGTSQVRFEWIDWQGDSVPYAVAPPGDLADGSSFFEVDTYTMHPWRVVDVGTEIEVARVVFHRDCAVRVSELARAAGQLTGASTVSCAGVQLTLDMLAEKQLAFAMAWHARLGAASAASCFDQHVFQLILDRKRALGTSRTSAEAADLDVGRSGPTCMRARAEGVGMACDDRGNIFLADRVAGRVIKVQRSDAQVVWSIACACPLGIAYDGEMDAVFVVARAANRLCALQAHDGTVLEQWGDASSNLCLASGLAVHGDLVCVVETGRDRLTVFRKADGSFVRHIPVQGQPRGVAFTPKGDALVVALRGGTRALEIVDVNGGGTLTELDYPPALQPGGIIHHVFWEVSRSFEPSTWKPDSIAVDPQQGLILVCEVTTGAVYCWRADDFSDKNTCYTFCGTLGGDPVMPRKHEEQRRDPPRGVQAQEPQETTQVSVHDAGAPEGADGAGGGGRSQLGQLAACGAAVRITSQVAGVAVDPLSGHALLARAVRHELVDSAQVPTNTHTST